MLYEAALSLHLTCFAGWSALTLGGFYVMRRARSFEALKAYYDLVKLEVAAAICLPATGIFMAAMRWGFQGWIALALVISIFVGVLEALHVFLVRSSIYNRDRDIDSLIRGVDRLAALFTVFYILMIYIMVFKPQL